MAVCRRHRMIHPQHTMILHALFEIGDEWRGILSLRDPAILAGPPGVEEHDQEACGFCGTDSGTLFINERIGFSAT